MQVFCVGFFVCKAHPEPEAVEGSQQLSVKNRKGCRITDSPFSLKLKKLVFNCLERFLRSILEMQGDKIHSFLQITHL